MYRDIDADVDIDRGLTDHANIRIQHTMVSGIPLNVGVKDG